MPDGQRKILIIILIISSYSIVYRWALLTTGGQFFTRESDGEISMWPQTGKSCKENFVFEKFSNALFFF